MINFEVGKQYTFDAKFINDVKVGKVFIFGIHEVIESTPFICTSIHEDGDCQAVDRECNIHQLRLWWLVGGHLVEVK